MSREDGADTRSDQPQRRLVNSRVDCWHEIILAESNQAIRCGIEVTTLDSSAT
jgi:hypothetical protein